MRYPSLLFDADGTLFDYDGAEGTALESTLARFGYTMRAETRALYRRLNATLWQVIALHHKGGKLGMPLLNGKTGTYGANEGISLPSIVAAMAQR